MQKFQKIGMHCLGGDWEDALETSLVENSVGSSRIHPAQAVYVLQHSVVQEALQHVQELNGLSVLDFLKILLHVLQLSRKTAGLSLLTR